MSCIVCRKAPRIMWAIRYTDLVEWCSPECQKASVTREEKQKSALRKAEEAMGKHAISPTILSQKK